METTDGTKVTLTPDQKRILLVLCEAADRCKPGAGLKPINGVRLVTNQAEANPIRETTTGCALVRKGLAVRLSTGTFQATLEGFWLGDTLRAADRRGEIPARRTA